MTRFRCHRYQRAERMVREEHGLEMERTVASDNLRLALPSKGRIEEGTRAFFERVGFPVRRPNARQYVGSLRGISDLSVLFQRASDIVAKVERGLADVGITGLDLFTEYQADNDAVMVLMPDLGFSR